MAAVRLDPALRARWESAEGRGLAAEARSWLLGGGRRPGGLRDHRGRLDLRGLMLGSLPAEPVRGVKWSSLDLSGAELAGLQLVEARIRHCLFDDAMCPGWRLRDTRVEHTSFRGASLKGSGLAARRERRGNRWERVSFDSADLTDSLWKGGRIHACTFRDSRLVRAQFIHVSFDGAVFSGELRETMFDGRDLPGEPKAGRLQYADFSQAMFADVEFRGYRFRRVRLPAGVKAVPHWPAVCRRGLELLADDPSAEARMLADEFRNWIRMPGHGDSTGVFNRADYVVAGGEALAALAEYVLWRAEREVAEGAKGP